MSAPIYPSQGRDRGLWGGVWPWFVGPMFPHPQGLTGVGNAGNWLLP